MNFEVKGWRLKGFSLKLKGPRWRLRGCSLRLGGAGTEDVVRG